MPKSRKRGGSKSMRRYHVIHTGNRPETTLVSHKQVGFERNLEKIKQNDSETTHLDLVYRMNGFEMNELANALKTNTHLTYLDLQNCQIGDKGAVLLAEMLVENKSLRMLLLMKNNITDFGAKALAEALKSNVTLTRLGLYSNPITEEGLDALEDVFIFNVGITQLWVSGRSFFRNKHRTENENFAFFFTDAMNCDSHAEGLLSHVLAKSDRVAMKYYCLRTRIDLAVRGLLLRSPQQSLNSK